MISATQMYQRENYYYYIVDISQGQKVHLSRPVIKLVDSISYNFFSNIELTVLKYFIHPFVLDIFSRKTYLPQKKRLSTRRSYITAINKPT